MAQLMTELIMLHGLGCLCHIQSLIQHLCYQLTANHKVDSTVGQYAEQKLFFIFDLKKALP